MRNPNDEEMLAIAGDENVLLAQRALGEIKMTKLNASIPLPLPPRIARLPINDRGFPVPWFVQWIDGEPDFRVMDAAKLQFCAWNHNPPCWICGEPLGVHRVFAIGPMCAINRVISEPPSHRECAEFAVRACPFLVNPRTRRNAKDLPDDAQDPAGIHIDRNPGVTCLWETREYQTFHPRAGDPGFLFKLGKPTRADWYAHGRPASRDEVMMAIATGLPQLLEIARAEGALSELEALRREAVKLLPAA
jgi:hypothetical protein